MNPDKIRKINATEYIINIVMVIYYSINVPDVITFINDPIPHNIKNKPIINTPVLNEHPQQKSKSNLGKSIQNKNSSSFTFAI